MAASPPAINITVEDGGLGIAPIGTDGASFKIGVSSLGTVNTVYNLADPSSIKATLGVGPLVEAAVYHANKSNGKPQYLIPVNASVAGSCGSITHTGTGPTITESGAPEDGYSVVVTITTAGLQGAGAFTYSLDGGETTSPALVVPTSGAYAIPNTGMTLNFPAGTLSAVGGTHTGPTVTVSGTPTTLSNVVITISTGGLSDGTAKFTYTINGGTPSAPIAIPNGGGTYTVPGTGVTATFANGTYVLSDTYSWTVTGVPYVLGDKYTFTATAPGYSTTDLGAALDALRASSFAARSVHIVGFPADAAGAAAVVALVQTELDTAAGAFKFMRGVAEMPLESNASDSQLTTAFSAVNAPRVGACAGSAQFFSDVVTGREYRRSSGLAVAARLAAAPISDDLGWTGSPLGAVQGINVASPLPGNDSRGLWRDETKTPGLDAQRFITLRTFPLVPGIFITKGRLMAAPGSDFSLVQYGVIIDVACETAYVAAFPFLNAKLPTDPTTGFILDDAARNIEVLIEAALEDALVTAGHASAVTVQVGRANDILSDGTLYVTIRIQPDGYPSEIVLDIGFVNPALLAQAA